MGDRGGEGRGNGGDRGGGGNGGDRGGEGNGEIWGDRGGKGGGNGEILGEVKVKVMGRYGVIGRWR